MMTIYTHTLNWVKLRLKKKLKKLKNSDLLFSFIIVIGGEIDFIQSHKAKIMQKN